MGEYKDGKMNGYGTYTFNDGVKYIGDFKDGNMEGFGTLIFLDGEKQEGNYRNNLFVRK